MWLAGLGRRNDLLSQALTVAARLLALGAPLVQERRMQRAKHRAKPGCARQRADVVKNVDLDRVLRSGLRDRLLPLLWRRRFLGRDEPSAEIDPGSTEHQCCGDATPVKDAAGSDHWNRGYRIDNLRHQRHGAELATIASRLAALRNDHVNA